MTKRGEKASVGEIIFGFILLVGALFAIVAGAAVLLGSLAILAYAAGIVIALCGVALIAGGIIVLAFLGWLFFSKPGTTYDSD